MRMREHTVLLTFVPAEHEASAKCRFQHPPSLAQCDENPQVGGTNRSTIAFLQGDGRAGW
jgi:hypothetical protein